MKDYNNNMANKTRDEKRGIYNNYNQNYILFKPFNLIYFL